MFLRIIGVLILISVVAGFVVLVMGLKRAPEKIRDIRSDEALTSAGWTFVGIGLAFASGLSRIVAITGGLALYVYGLMLARQRKRRDVEL